MASIPAFSHEHLQAICDVLGDTSSGLTGSEIAALLRSCGIEDPLPGYTKRHRLFEALNQRQAKERCGNAVVSFIIAAMNPVRHVGHAGYFEQERDKLNEVLAFCGYELREDGKLRKVDAARTLTEAQGRANRLRSELNRREVHADVLRFCTAEIIQKDYFHAVLEATKSLADKIRGKTGLTSDGTQLVDEAFGIGSKRYPLLAFNSLQTETEKSEHTGLMNLMKGVFGAFRNPTAHEARIRWSMTEQDALDALTLLSMLHRRLDAAVPTPRADGAP